MRELDALFGQRDAALYREDMARVEQLEVEIARRAALLRESLVLDWVSEMDIVIKQLEEDLRGPHRD